MIVRIIIGIAVLLVSVVLYLLGACNIDLWVLIATGVIVIGVLLLQYRQVRKAREAEED